MEIDDNPTRWKGENVSTMEVEATVSAVVGLRDCVVYGVGMMMMLLIIMAMMMAKMLIMKTKMMMVMIMVI